MMEKKGFVKNKSVNLKRRNVPRKLPKAQITNLPDEIMWKIFQYLDVESLLNASTVCKKWKDFSFNDLLWKQLFTCYATVSPFTFKQLANKKCSHEETWKNRFKKYFTHSRNHYLKGKNKLNLFTYTTDKMDVVQATMGVKFQLCVIDKNGEQHCLTQNWKKVFNSSTLLQWFSLNVFPPWSKIKQIQVFCLVPVLFGSNKKPLRTSPNQRSLVCSVSIQDSVKVFSNEKIVLYVCQNIAIALWKDSSEIAFVCASVHHHNLFHKMLHSTETVIYSLPHSVFCDDVDTKYGLHSYNCHMHLHSFTESFWQTNFSNIKCQAIGGYALFEFPTFSRICEKDPTIVWKTDLFRGKLQDCAILDVIVSDLNKDVIWDFSSIVVSSIVKEVDLSFDNSESIYLFHYLDNIGFVKLCYCRTSETCEVTSIEMGISLPHVNKWFGRSY